MKKHIQKLFVMAALLVQTVVASAQENAYPRFELGLRAGASVNNYMGDMNVDDLWGPQGGVSLAFRVAPFPLYLETGAYYMNKGFSLRYRGNRTTVDDHCIYVPACVSYHFHPGRSVTIRPFVGEYLGYQTESEKLNAGMRTGCGVDFRRLYMSVGMDVGVTNMIDNDDDWNHHRNWASPISLFATVGLSIFRK